MKKSSFFVLSMMALTCVFGFSACSSSEEEVVNNPNYDSMELAGIAVDSETASLAEELIVAGIKNRQECIDMEEALIPADSFQDIICRALNDHPELYYVDPWYSFSVTDIDDAQYVDAYWPNYCVRYPEGTEEERLHWKHWPGLQIPSKGG